MPILVIALTTLNFWNQRSSIFVCIISVFLLDITGKKFFKASCLHSQTGKIPNYVSASQYFADLLQNKDQRLDNHKSDIFLHISTRRPGNKHISQHADKKVSLVHQKYNNAFISPWIFFTKNMKMCSYHHESQVQVIQKIVKIIII